MAAFRPFLSVFCVFLLLNDLTLVPRSLGAEIPATYHWQIERLASGDNAWATVGMESDDISFAYQDIPGMYFPMQLMSTEYMMVRPPDGLTTQLWTTPYFLDGTGTYGWYMQYATVKAGRNILYLDSVDCNQCDIYFWKGPALWLGLQSVVVGFGDPVDPTNVAIGTPDDPNGPWEGFNLVCDSDLACFDVNPYLHGNFGIRVEYRPLCPNRVGDIDDDCHIDAADVALVQGCWQGPGVDLWDTTCKYCDLDNDNDVDDDDLAIVNQNFTGGAPVQCAVIGLDKTSISHNGTTGTNLPDETFTVQNIGCGNLEYTVSSPSWLSVSPDEGSSTGEVDTITIHYNTAGLDGGTHTGYITVFCSDAVNNPQTITVTVTLETPGDFDGDNDVDHDDYVTFEDCATGPEVSYSPLPPACTLTPDGDGRIAADFDLDADVDQDDFGVFQEYFDAYPVASSAPPAEPPQCDSGLVALAGTQFNLPSLTTLMPPGLGFPRTGAQGPPKDPNAKFNYIIAGQVVWVCAFLTLLALIGSVPYNIISQYNWNEKVGSFIYHGKHHGIWVDDRPQGDPIRVDIAAALQELRNTGNPTAVRCVEWYELYGWGDTGHHIIAVNTSASDVDLKPCAGTAAGIDHVVVLHHAYVQRQYDPYKRWGTKGIALLLFAEWQHQDSPGKSEGQLETELTNWRNSVPAFKDVAPEVVHGEAEGTGG